MFDLDNDFWVSRTHTHWRIRQGFSAISDKNAIMRRFLSYVMSCCEQRAVTSFLFSCSLLIILQRRSYVMLIGQRERGSDASWWLRDFFAKWKKKNSSSSTHTHTHVESNKQKLMWLSVMSIDRIGDLCLLLGPVKCSSNDCHVTSIERRDWRCMHYTCILSV